MRERGVVVAAHLVHHPFDVLAAGLAAFGEAAGLLLRTLRFLVELRDFCRHRARCRHEALGHEDVRRFRWPEHPRVLQGPVQALLRFDERAPRFDVSEEPLGLADEPREALLAGDRLRLLQVSAGARRTPGSRARSRAGSRTSPRSSDRRRSG